MGKIFIGLIIFGVVTLFLNDDIPDVISESFDSKYQNAIEVNWSFKNDQYVASFEHSAFSKSAIFSKNGIWIKTTTSIPIYELENCLTQYLNDQYFDFEVVKAEFIENKAFKRYYITIAKVTNEEGIENSKRDHGTKENARKNCITLKFDSDCNFLNEERSLIPESVVIMINRDAINF